MNIARIIWRGITVIAMAALCALIAMPAFAAYEDSLKGYWKMDEFNRNDNFGGTSLNAERWSPLSFSGSYAVNDDLTLSGNNSQISGNLFLTGDFDVQVDYSAVQWGGNSGSKSVSLIMMNSAGDKFLYSVRGHNDSSNYYTRMDCVNGNWYCDSTVSTSDTSGKLRITRSGSTFTAYEWTGSAWTTLSPPASSQSFSEPANIRLVSWSNDAAISAHFDNVKVANELVADAKGTNNGTAIGATSVASQTGYGNALNFNGTSDYVKVPDSSSWNFGAGNFTINFKVKSNGNNTGNGIFSSNIDGSPSWNTANGDYLVYFSDASTIYMAQWDGSAGHWVSPISNVEEGVWTDISYVRSGDTLYAYKDGVMQGSGANVAGLTFDGSAIGFGRQASFGGYFDGSLDDTAIWNRALDANEIDMIYDLGTEKFEWLTLGVNDQDALNLGYTTSELKLLAELYADGNTSASETIDSITWHYLSGDLPGDIGGTTYDYGDTWTYDGKSYIKLGSGLEGTSIPEPGCAFGLLVGFFVPGFRRLLKRKV